MSEIDMGNVWDVGLEVRRNEVLAGTARGVGDTDSTTEEYVKPWSLECQSRPHMFGKGGQGTTARRDQLAPASNEE